MLEKIRAVHIDASTVCQLACRSCPTARGQTGRHLGSGFLRVDDLARFLERHPDIASVELSNWGEIFLNPELEDILCLADRLNVALTASTGANLNSVGDSALEALVRYRLRTLTCSLDGATQKTYEQYRVNGNFDRVIGAIWKINSFKSRYRSPYPRLKWQFVLFDHNAHELEAAHAMAKRLDMTFSVKLSWADLYTEPFSPVSDEVGKKLGLDLVSREQFKRIRGRDYFRDQQCAKMFHSPQINYDGRVLGCCVNYWADYGNAFELGLAEVMNGERFAYARRMLSGRAVPRHDIPCSRCPVYQEMARDGSWLPENGRRFPLVAARELLGLEKRLCRLRPVSRLSENLWKILEMKRERENKVYSPAAAGVSSGVGANDRRGRRTASLVRQVRLPLALDQGRDWQPYPQFTRRTGRMRFFSCHVSVLRQGCCPHPAHRHQEEEILLVLDGEVEIALPDVRQDNAMRQLRLQPGDFVYYPAFFAHTLTGMSEQPAQYLMFKWHDLETLGANGLQFAVHSASDLIAQRQIEEGFRPKILLEGATGCLRRLQCHTSTLSPKSGYAPHADPYDTAVILLEGQVETLGRRAEAHDIIFYAAGELHGMHNPGATPAKYLVFEFEGRPKHILDHIRLSGVRLLRKVGDRHNWIGLRDRIMATGRKRR